MPVPSLVVCGNGVDVTHCSASVSSVLFRGVGVGDSLDVNDRYFFVDGPCQPFESLARSVTNDAGLKFAPIAFEDESMDMEIDEELNSRELPSWKPKFVTGGNPIDDRRENWNWLREQISSSPPSQSLENLLGRRA